MSAGLSFLGGFLTQYNDVKDAEREKLAKEAEAAKKRTADLDDWYTKQKYQEKETERAEARALTRTLEQEKRAEIRDLAKEERARLAAQKKAEEKRSRVSKSVLDEYDVATSRYTEGTTSEFPIFSYDPAQDVPSLRYLKVPESGFSQQQSQIEVDRMNKELQGSGITTVKFINAPQKGGGFLPTKIDIKKEDVGPPLDPEGYPIDNKYPIYRHIGDKNLIKKGESAKYSMLSLDGTPLGSGPELRDRFLNNPDSYFVYRTVSDQTTGPTKARDILRSTVTEFTPDRVRAIYENKDKSEAGARQNRAMVNHIRNVIADYRGSTVITLNDSIKFSNALEEQPDLMRLADVHPEIKQLLKSSPPPDMSKLPPELRDTVFADMSDLANFEKSGEFPMLTNLTAEDSPFAVDGEGGVKMMEPQFKNQINTITSTSNISANTYLKALNGGVKPGLDSNGKFFTPSTEHATAIHKGVLRNRNIIAASVLKGFLNGPNGEFAMPPMDPDDLKIIAANISLVTDQTRRLNLLQASLTDSALMHSDTLLKSTTAEGMYQALGMGGVTNFNNMKKRGEAATQLQKQTAILKELIDMGAQMSVVGVIKKFEDAVSYNFNAATEYFDSTNQSGLSQRVKAIAGKLTGVRAIENRQQRLNSLKDLYAQSIVFLHARIMDPEGRLSVDDVQRSEAATGLGTIFTSPDYQEATLSNLNQDAGYYATLYNAYTSKNPAQMIAARLYEKIAPYQTVDFLTRLGLNPVPASGSGTAAPAVNRNNQNVQQLLQYQNNSPVSALEQQTREQSEASAFTLE